MNTDLGRGVYLEHSYNRDLQKFINYLENNHLHDLSDVTNIVIMSFLLELRKQGLSSQSGIGCNGHFHKHLLPHCEVTILPRPGGAYPQPVTPDEPTHLLLAPPGSQDIAFLKVGPVGGVPGFPSPEHPEHVQVNVVGEYAFLEGFAQMPALSGELKVI